MKFTKMQGAGNDYIYVDCTEKVIDNPSAVAKKISDRHFGVGSDGLVLICRSDVADFKMMMFNSDGSQAEMCGNASRCIGKFVYDKGLTKKKEVTLETLAGIKTLMLHIGKEGTVESVTVNMGRASLDPSVIPVATEKNPAVDVPVTTENGSYLATCVTVGNPHAVIFVDESFDLKGFDIEKIGRPLEISPIFPNKSNIEFVMVTDQDRLTMRVWERGAGETLACGTGACAVFSAARAKGLCDSRAEIKLLGGTLNIEDKNGEIFMTGPAEFVFDGEIK